MTLVNHTKYLDFKFAKSPNNSDWYYVKRTNDKGLDSAVVVTTLVKIQNEYCFHFILTKRPPIYAENKAEFCLESPAGLVGDILENESIIECANKELLEETGLKADKMFLELSNSSTSGGLSSETLSYVTAICYTNKIFSSPISDGGIISERLYIKSDEIYNYLNTIDKTKISVASPTVCGIFFGLKRLELLTK